jgi:hypothetical protein
MTQKQFHTEMQRLLEVGIAVDTEMKLYVWGAGYVDIDRIRYDDDLKTIIIYEEQPKGEQ